MVCTKRTLHYVFKIGNRKEADNFFRNILGMKILRHEEFEEGCAATCNGPYEGKWSKTMIGYGPEDNHFVCELTYNYGISNYEMGDSFRGFYIQSSEAIQRARSANIPMEQVNKYYSLLSPDGYRFFLSDQPQPRDRDPVEGVAFACTNLKDSLRYWNELAGMSVLEKSDKSATLRFKSSDAKLILEEIGKSVNHAKAFGRIAFSCPAVELKEIERKMLDDKQTILTPYISLDTPGKATVQVVILADPNGHEICFVGEEGFRSLSQVDPDAKKLLEEAMAKDKSEEWFTKHKGGKFSA